MEKTYVTYVSYVTLLAIQRIDLWVKVPDDLI